MALFKYHSCSGSCSQSLEEVGEVPGSTHVPHHVVEQADDVHHLCLNKTLCCQYCSTLGSPMQPALSSSDCLAFSFDCLASRPRKSRLSSRSAGRAWSPGCQLAGSSNPPCKDEIRESCHLQSRPRPRPTPWWRPPASPSPWGSSPRTYPSK